jgi:hypothetical protein
MKRISHVVQLLWVPVLGLVAALLLGCAACQSDCDPQADLWNNAKPEDIRYTGWWLVDPETSTLVFVPQYEEAG